MSLPVINRMPTVNGIAQGTFTSYIIGGNKYRKAMYLDGVGDVINTAAMNNAGYQSVIGSDLPFTVYWRGKLDQLANDVISGLFTLRRTSTTNSRIIFSARGETGDKVHLQLTTVSNAGAAAAIVSDSTLAQSYTPNTYLELTFVLVTTGSIKAYFGDTDITGTASAATLTNPNAFTAASDYVFSIGYSGTTYYNGTHATLAVFGGQNYTPAQCRANIASAPLLYRYANGQSTVVTNLGTGGATYNGALTINSSEAAIHTLFKE